MTEEKQEVKLTYIGMPGSDFGFKLAGVETMACADGEALTDELKKIALGEGVGVVFVDERLALAVQEEVDEITAAANVSVVLLPNPAQPMRLAAKKMDRLMIQAIGSDIFSK